MDLSEMVAEVVSAPPEEVFALLTHVELMSGLGPEHVGARWVGTARGFGAVFVGVNRREGIGTWEVRCRVVEHEPPARFAWAAGDADEPSALWSLHTAPGRGRDAGDPTLPAGRYRSRAARARCRRPTSRSRSWTFASEPPRSGSHRLAIFATLV
jgi:uncharacterized protein YndB with AHSA1/START domain